MTKTEGTSGILWKRLSKEEKKVPLWYDMKGLFDDDMESYGKILEKEEEEKEKVLFFILF